MLLSKPLLGISAILFLAGEESAEASGCSLAMAFALDISISVDTAEYRLQREGLAAALTDPMVSELIVAHPGDVAMIAYEWSSEKRQVVVVPWHQISSEADLRSFSTALVDYPLVPYQYSTAIGRAVAFGLNKLNEKPHCERKVLDVSGDGINNDGYPPGKAYEHFPVTGITVNGLVVEGADEKALTYYEEHVIHGAGAFVEVAESFEEYEEAMKRKLLREVSGPQLSLK